MVRTLVLCLLACALAVPLAAREVRVESLGASTASVARLQAQIEPAFRHIETRTGLRDTEDVHLVVAGTSRQFERLAATHGVAQFGENVLGYAIPSRRQVVINLSTIQERQLEPIAVLRHELAHLAMGSLLRVDRPLWFEEGVCQYVESMALNELREAAGSQALFVSFDSLDDLSLALREPARAGGAYLESREVLRLLVQRHGEDRFLHLMRLLREGESPFEQAFAAATGETLEAFEAAWHEDYAARSSRRWSLFLGPYWIMIVFAITGLGVIGALALRRSRGRSQLEVWEEEEELYPSDPSWSYTED
jgi:hypothetical protein